MRARVVAALLAVVLLTGGCETSFEVFAETDRYFSVWGYLDILADTQWVRVEPLQDSALIGSSPIDARVTSRNLETREQTVWQQSVYRLPTGQTFHNFWTDEAIDPEATYRFTVERREVGIASTAEVTTPERFPPPEVIGIVPGVGETYGSNAVTLTVHNVERLGTVEVFCRYLVCNKRTPNCYRRQHLFYHLSDTTRLNADTYRIRIPWIADVESTLGPNEEFAGFYVYRASVASVDTWPEYALPVDSLQAAPQPPVSGLESNIENGVGYLGGAAVRTVYVPIKQ